MIRVSYADSDLFRITNTSDQIGTLTITNGGGTLKYSLDGVDFETYDFSTHPTISVPAGANLYMKGTKTNSNNYALNFKMDVNHTIGGNIMSISDENNYTTMTSIPNYGFKELFKGDTYLISASNVNFGNVTTIGNNGLNDFFSGCTLLVSIPDLSNITTVGNAGLATAFYQCSSLVNGADLTSITSCGTNALSYTYTQCSSLTTAYAPNVSTWGIAPKWLQNVAASGTLYCPSQAVADLIPNNDINGCPSGWTKVVL